MGLYAEVLVDVANRRLDQSYHYQVPEHLHIGLGMRVLVQLQHRRVQALVVGINPELPGELSHKELRPIMEVLDEEYRMPGELMELARWLAENTICSLAQSIHTVWPLFKSRIEDWVLPAAKLDDPDVQTLKWLDEQAYQALIVLHRSKHRALSESTLLKRAGISKELLDQLVQQGWIKRETRVTSSAGRKEDSVKPRSITPGMPTGSQVVSANKDLTHEQANAIKHIMDGFNEAPKTVLLHGVTGSGKTEVYKEVIARVLSEGGDAILLVPEISLVGQVEEYFRAVFGSQVIILHSGISKGEKVRAWKQILSGEKHLVIGARSAVFAPLPNLRLIILDEEHDSAYKQDENPKYHARDVARMRMAQHRGVVLLGSATPSMEAYAAAQSGRVKLVTMKQRVRQSSLPPVEVIDMRAELAQGNRTMFSFCLQSKLRERIRRGEQSMLFLNRRGYATFVVCRECGYVVRCRHCDVALTYHTQGQVMRCHYCDYEESPPHTCPQCGSRYIRFFGQGTQRLEEELSTLFPNTPLIRLDGDSARAGQGHQEIIEKFRQQEGAIMVGTQMMAKGLDFPNVTLVGVIAADQTLNMPDFRARERTFQLLTQVAGRAGRSDKPGEVVIQTYSPHDRAIQRAANHDFTQFFWEEIQYRQEREYPPFTHMIRVMLLHEKEEIVIRGAQDMAMFLRKGMSDPEFGNTELDILGPAPAVFPRLKNKYRWQVAVKGKHLRMLRAFLHKGVQRFYHEGRVNGINLNIEVDPLST